MVDTMTLVNDGEKAWIYTRESGAIEHETPILSPTTGQLFDPAVLLPALELEPRGDGVVAGRAARLVLARARTPCSAPVDLVPAGCDEVQLVVDAEVGIVLRIESRFEREPVRIVEVQAIEFDKPFGDDRFRFEPPEGEEPRTAGRPTRRAR